MGGQEGTLPLRVLCYVVTCMEIDAYWVLAIVNHLSALNSRFEGTFHVTPLISPFPVALPLALPIHALR